MSVVNLKINNTRLTLVFRHRWDSQDEIRYNREFRDYSLGVDLLVCKMWVSFSRGGMSFKTDCFS